MRNRTRICVYLVFIWTLVLQNSVITAQTRTDNLDKYRITPIRVLPTSEINDVHQDKLGFTYFATLAGLFRYDGVNIKTYLSDPDSKNSLSTNMILDIVEDNNGCIWLGTYGRGISRLNPITDSLTNFKVSELANTSSEIDNIEAICIDKNNCIWVGNRIGIYKLKLDENSNIIKTTCMYDQSNKLDNSSVIKDIYQSANGDMWFGYTNAIYQVHYTESGDNITTEHNITGAQSLIGDQTGVYVGGTKVWHIPYNKETEQFSSNPIIIYNQKTTSIAKTDNHIFIGSREGVFCLKSKDNRWELEYTINKNKVPFPLRSDVISSVLTVSDDQIWVSTRGGGAYMITPKNKVFTNITTVGDNDKIELTRTLFQDSYNQLWLGTEQEGLIFFNDRRELEDYDYKRINIGTTYENRVYSLEETNNNGRKILWVGTTSPSCLVRIDAKTQKIIDHKDSTYTSIGNVFALKKSDDNTLWAGTYDNGLWRLTLNNKGEVVKTKQFNTINSNISSNIIRNISLDSKNELWIGTDMGINRIKSTELLDTEITFNHQLDRAGKFNTVDHYVLQITESSSGDMLLSTMGSGFLIYNPKTDEVKQITKKDNLANNSVKTIIEDTNTGKLWISTNYGLSSFNPKNDSVINYQDAGLLNTLEFSEYCGLMSFNGRIIFGNNAGITVFRPEEIEKDNNTPNPYLLNIYINDVKIEANEIYNGDRVLELSAEYTDSISLSYDNRNISFEFVGIDYVSTDLVQYSHYLEGFDQQWSSASTTLTRATYTNLREGDYTFKLRTANADGIWSDKILSIAVHIEPPFLRSTLAYIIYSLIILIFAIAVFYIQRTLYRKRIEVAKLQFENEKNEEITQARLQFFTNISHEFRTPLTLIGISLESIEERAWHRSDSDDIEDGSIIRRNANILKNLIDEQLEFRRIETGKSVHKPRQMEINRFIELFYSHFKPLAKKRNINFNFNPYSENLVANIDNRQMQKVMFNLISNSFKHTSDGSDISLNVELDKSKIIIKVKDNGNGIAAENLPFIFDRFYQAKSENFMQEEGSGIGLALCKKIMLLHGGNIELESTEGKGTTSILTLDLLLQAQAIDADIEYCIDKKYAARYKWVDESSKPSITKQDIENKTLSLLDTIENEEMYDDNESSSQPKLLIVEDNATLLDKLSTLFENRFTVYKAEDGIKGLEMAKNYWPDIILLDLMMPNMNGIEMCKILKTSEETSHIPVIMMTANSNDQNQLDSYKVAKVDAYIEKPFNIQVLKNLISTILENRKLTIQRFNQNVIVNVDELSDSTADKKFLQEVLAIIKRNMDNSELTIEHIASEYGVSRVYLNRKIKALTNLTSNQFLRDVRLKKAARLLKNNELNINEIAWQVGYNDIRTFRTRFKEMFGVTPSTYAGRAEK